MARLSFDIPDEHIPVLLDAFAAVYNYQDQIEDPNEDVVRLIPNPESKQQFAKRRIINFIKNTYTKHKSDMDIMAAREQSRLDTLATADSFTEV